MVSLKNVKSELLGHVTATDIANSIMNVMKTSKMELNYLLMLGSDGIGTCNLHIVHNAFVKGIITYEPFSNITDFLENIHTVERRLSEQVGTDPSSDKWTENLRDVPDYTKTFIPLSRLRTGSTS